MEMLMIRTIQDKDISQVVDIHKQFYEKTFPFPDLSDPKWLGKYVVTDDYDNVILFGGAKLIVEAIAVTDKRRSVRDRREALMKLLQAEIFCCGAYNFDQLHAFIQDPIWEGHLKKYGFRNCKGQAIVIDT